MPTPAEIIDVCGRDPGNACKWVYEQTSSEALAKLVDFIVARPLKIAVIIAVAFVVNRLLHRAISRFASGLEGVSERGLHIRGRTAIAPPATVSVRSSARAQTVAAVLRSLSTIVVWTFAMMLILGALDIQLGPFIAGAGIVGVAVGFGAQSLVKDFLTGLFMLLEDQYGVGDVVDIGEATGTVEAISLRSTRVRDVYGTLWHVPNGQIVRVGNKSQQWARALLDVTVAHGTDLRQAKDIIKRVADELWHDEAWESEILEEPEVWGVEQFAANGITIRAVIKTSPASQWKVLRELRLRLKEAFDEAGIELPVTQPATPSPPAGS